MEIFSGSSDSRDWHYVAAAVNASVRVPDYDGPESVVGAERNWWRPKQAVGDMIACEHCYYLYFAASFMEDDWEPVDEEDMVAADGMTTWICDMTLLPMKLAHLKAMRGISSRIFGDAARTIMSSPPCPLNEQDEGVWHGLAPYGSYGGTCARCFAGIIVPFGFQNHFTQLSLPANLKFTCIFNARTPLFSQTMDKLDEAICKQTLPRIQSIMALTRMRLQQQQMLMMSGLMLQGLDYTVTAVQGPGHDRYGFASIGYNYATMSGVQGAQQYHQGMNMNVVNGGDVVLVAQLEQMWKEVE
ncbi:hypothetical protein TMatcc_010315 [Talaromyces marneffei ATCC 18224]|uniref:Uncharacterized protein n=1 Tax=Talaromyces marneffei (strain ATCC 18224 / CBS 334.59 / QM 7333) TaxID=441960 RepID=B6QVS6_TALMQ|nr:uncharacterized protein EYB26_009889 [Talaromyces marneffei]EEA19139.1 conserved hypothetical protein [Talaromyces marneffei ATCC 18224]KAE8548832.1 hypothetical protein EYB25_009213 [Talaromyces marneffei]QGA22175.1 hypothetical protein EYB26_009889 [Talaromyces marneffei]